MTQIYIKQNIHKHRTQNFRRISPFGITPVEKAHKAMTIWYRGPFRRFINTRFRKSIKKEWTEAIKKILKYYINALQQIPVSYCSMLHIPPTNCLLLTAKQEPYKKAYLLTKNIEEFSGKSLEGRAIRQKTIRQKG